VFTPNTRQVVKIVREYGFDLRVVGGAVRDFILGKPPRDVDFATDADPSELIYIFQMEGIAFDSKGIGHGTIKAVFGNEKIDVTSITYKLSVKDHKVTVTQRSSWEADASHRDLTINSLSMDLNGRIYDYRDGMEDLNNQVIRFNPGITKSLQSDPHLIMRWFKALGYFSNPHWPVSDWHAVKDHMQLLSNIKDDEKTQKELASIMQGKNSANVLRLMCRAGANKYLDLTCDF
jgi:tRNA nucleotidyltransferase/poly(A) polymerase